MYDHNEIYTRMHVKVSTGVIVIHVYGLKYAAALASTHLNYSQNFLCMLICLKYGPLQEPCFKLCARSY